MNEFNKLSGEKLTYRIRKGIKESKKPEGFQYKKSVTEMFNRVQKLQKTLEAYSNKIKESTPKLAVYSIDSFEKLLTGISQSLRELDDVDGETCKVINHWLIDFNSVDSEDALRTALWDLNNQLRYELEVPKDSYDIVFLNLNKILNEYYNATGELFTFGSDTEEGDIPDFGKFSKIQEEVPKIIKEESKIEPKPELSTETYSNPKLAPKKLGKIRSYSKSVSSKIQTQLNSNSYGSMLNRVNSFK